MSMSAVAEVKMRAQSVTIAPLKLAYAHICHYISEPYLTFIFLFFCSFFLNNYSKFGLLARVH